MRCLIVKAPWARMIVRGEKPYEIRSRPTRIRERVGIIEAGTGTIIGTVVIDGCTEYARWGNRRPYRFGYGWALWSPKEYKRPRRYKHPRGAQVWVNV